MRIRCPTTVSTTSTSSRSVARKAREREHRKRQKEQHSRRRADAGRELDDDDHPATRRVRAEHASPYAYTGRRPSPTKQELRETRMRQMEEEAATRRAQEQPASPLKRGWQFIYNSFMPAFGFSNSGDAVNDMPPPPTTPTRSRPKKTYHTPGGFPGMALDSDSESSSPARPQDVEMGDETQSPSPPGPDTGTGKATTPDSASFSSTAASSSSGNRSSFYAFPSTPSAATSTEDFFSTRTHICSSATCSEGCHFDDLNGTFRIFNDTRFTGADEDMFSREEKEAERSRKRAEDRRRREEEEREREREREQERERARREAEKERIRREQFKREREEHERKEREKREQDEADYKYVQNIFGPIAEMEMSQARKRGETEEQLRERQWKIWDEWEILIERARRQREEKERLEREREREREEKRRKEREEKARKEREEAERKQRHEHKSKSSTKQSRSHPYARSSNSNRKRGGLHFEPSDDPFARPSVAGDSPFHRGCRRPNFKKPNFGASRTKATPKPTFTSVPKPPTSPTPGASSSCNLKKYSKIPATYFEWYESEWAVINSLRSATPLTFKDVPWALVQMPYLPDQVTSAGVKAFMTSKHSSFATTGSKHLTMRERRIAAKKELMNWHPDKFATRVLERVLDSKEKELIKEAADVVQKALTEFMRGPDGAAD